MVIFRRSGVAEADYSLISGKVVELKLPPHLEDISSTRIRDAVDQGRDISNLIDPVAQDLIYRQGLYLREPLDKPLLSAGDIQFCYQAPEEDWGGPAAGGPPRPAGGDGGPALRPPAGRDGGGPGGAELLPGGARTAVRRLGSTRLAGFVRERTGGRALVISGMWCARTRDPMEICQALITEVLTCALRQGHGCALFCPAQDFVPGYVRELLALQGFVPAPAPWQGREVLAVDMSRPIVLTRNMETVLKAPFTGSAAVLTALNAAHRRLQTALTGLYPGCLVLSISASVIHHRLLHMITAANGVSAQPTRPGCWGSVCACPSARSSGAWRCPTLSPRPSTPTRCTGRI